VRRDREPEAHIHARRVGPHRNVDELFELGERDDLVHLLVHVPALEAMDGAVHVDVLAAGEVRVEAGTELEERGNAAADLEATVRRTEDTRDHAKERRLAGAVPANDPDRLTGVDLE
jgi:hypothetical protein